MTELVPGHESGGAPEPREHLLHPHLVRPLAESDLGPRAIRALSAVGARCLWDAISISREELLAAKNCGASTVARIEARLGAHGLALGSALPLGGRLARIAARDPFDAEPISTRLRNVLRANSIMSWQAAANLVESELLLQRNVGRGTVAELRRELARRGLELRASRAEPEAAVVPDRPSESREEALPPRASIAIERPPGLGDLSKRLQRVLRALGARSLADAARFTREQVNGFRGIGATTVSELEERLARIGLGLANEPSARGANDPATGSPVGRQAPPPPKVASETLTPVLPADAPLDLLAELICAGDPSRRRLRFLWDLIGWNGGGARTLQEIGTAAGLTRERVRQLAAKAIRAIGNQPVFFDRLRGAIAAIERAAPCSLAQANDGLRRGGWLQRTGDVGAVLRLGERIGLSSRVEVCPLDGFSLIATAAEARATRAWIDQIRKQVRRWGAASICDVVPPRGNAPRFVDLFPLLEGFEWLDDDEQWFWLRGVEGNRVVRRLRAIASVAGSCTMDEVANGLARDLRIRERPLPRAVLERLCARMEFWVRQGPRWVCPRPLPRTDLGPDEGRVVELLEAAGGAALTLEIEEAAAKRGISTPSLWRYLSFSPVITHPATGIYAVVGATYDQAALQRTRQREAASTPRVRRAQGWGVTRDGRRWLALLLSPGACRRGIIGIPAMLELPAGGAWPIVLPDGAAAGTMRANGAAAWGFGAALQRLQAGAEDLLILAWNVEATAVAVHVRDPALLHRLRQESLRRRT